MFYDLKVEILTFLFLRSEHYFGDVMWKAHAFMFTLVVLCHGAKLHLEGDEGIINDYFCDKIDHRYWVMP